MVLLATSCTDFLTEDPKGQLSQDNFFTSQSDLDMAVTALYSRVNSNGTNTNPMGYNWLGDDLTTHPASNKQAYAEYVKFASADDNKCNKATWESWYKTIKCANYIILNAEKTPVSKEEVNIALGQAYFWRAFSYFILVRVFGDLPMNLDNVINVEVKPTPVADVYTQIISDLTKAAEILPTKYSSSPRQWEGVATYITKQAALSTLSCVYLNKAGWPLNGGDADYTKAADYAKQVIDGCKSGTYEYDLLPEYSQVYSLSHNYNTETVVASNHSKDFDWDQDTEMGVSNIFESQGGWGDAWGTYRFWKEFPEGARKEATFMPKIMVLVGTNKGHLADFWEKDGSGAYYIAEHHPAYQIYCASYDGRGDFDYTYATDFRIGNACTGQRRHFIRYSEVLLWYAEASARATKQVNSDALTCLNKVRERAGEAPIAEGSLDAAAFADLAFQEHGWEVAGYFSALQTRRMDMQRMNKMGEVFANRVADGTNGVEVAPGVTLVEDIKPSGSFSEDLIYSPYNDVDKTLNPYLQ